jgi:hypothetical protein
MKEKSDAFAGEESLPMFYAVDRILNMLLRNDMCHERRWVFNSIFSDRGFTAGMFQTRLEQRRIS